MKKGSYGSVLIHLRDGEVTGVKDNVEYNPAAFVDMVEKPVKRYVVRNSKIPEIIEKAESEQIVQNSEQIEEIDEIPEKDEA